MRRPPLLVLALLAGCTGPDTRFFLLMPAVRPPSKTPSATAPLIGVGPVAVPYYLDRPQIVLRTGKNEVELAELHQWAEPVKDGLTRVLAENLGIRLDSDRIVLFPWRRAVQVDWQVRVEVGRFEAALGGDCVLIARWTLLDGQGETRASHLSDRKRPAGPTIHGAVQALSALIDDLAGEMADEVRRLHAPSGP